jgi:hypothetical protein
MTTAGENLSPAMVFSVSVGAFVFSGVFVDQDVQKQVYFSVRQRRQFRSGCLPDGFYLFPSVYDRYDFTDVRTIFTLPSGRF